MQLRLKLGQGKLPDDALMFSDLDGNPASPRAISKCWEAFADKVGVGAGRFHNLRHTQASLLHTKISITLNLSTPTSSQDADDRAAAALNATLSGGKSAG